MFGAAENRIGQSGTESDEAGAKSPSLDMVEEETGRKEQEEVHWN